MRGRSGASALTSLRGDGYSIRVEEENAMQEATRGETKPLVVGPADGEAPRSLGTRIVIKATSQSTGGTFGLLENQLATGFSPPLHIHHQEDESFWILEGKLTLVVDIDRKSTRL